MIYIRKYDYFHPSMMTTIYSIAIWNKENGYWKDDWRGCISRELRDQRFDALIRNGCLVGLGSRVDDLEPPNETDTLVKELVVRQQPPYDIYERQDVY